MFIEIGGQALRETLQEVVDLQTRFSATATPEMERRGMLVRKTLRADIESHGSSLRKLLGKFGDDAKAEGKDNQGQYARIPWARWFSASRSPSATSGWYVVYLFHPDGSGVSLCLSHGSTQIVGTGFVNRSDAEVAELMSWAAGVLGAEFERDPGIRLGIELGAFDLARGYERTTVASKFYASGRIPSDAELFADLERFVRPLARLYQAQESGLVPGSVSADMLGQLDDVEKAASPLKNRPKGQGRLPAPLRKMVELHAMNISRQWLKDEGFEYEDVSASDSCDFRARRQGEDWVIEVKGTTGGLGNVLLTRNEVTLHRISYPFNALLVVHGISLTGADTTSPKVQGGELAVFSPWQIETERLSPVAYEYRLPT